MAVVKFLIQHWTLDGDLEARLLARISSYTNTARAYGMSPTEIGMHIEQRWPEIIPGGVAAAIEIAEISAYVEAASRSGMTDPEIGTEIAARWPHAIPGGAVVSTGEDRVISVTSAHHSTRRGNGAVP